MYLLINTNSLKKQSPAPYSLQTRLSQTDHLLEKLYNSNGADHFKRLRIFQRKGLVNMLIHNL